MLKSKVLRERFKVLSVAASSLLRAAILLSVSLLLVQAHASAQEPQEVDVLRVTTDLIVFPVRVVDKQRRSVLNLTATDFAIKDEDGITSAPYFAAGTGRVAIVFALDESGSLRAIISQQHDAAVSLFSRFKENSRIAALRFAERPSLVAPFDTDAEAVRSAFSFPARPNQHTAIFDGAYAAVEAFSKLPFDIGERRIVVLISDGLDNVSRIKPSEVIDAAAEANVSFYVIHLPLFAPRDGRLSIRPTPKGFRELAEKTGGKYFLSGDVDSALSGKRNQDLSPVFQAIEDDLKSQYLIGFYLNEQSRDGRTHRVSLSVKPAGLVYSTQNRRFARTHQFLVDVKAHRRVAIP